MTAAVSGDKDMRDWLRAQGEPVKDRGKIAARLAEKYYGEFPDRRPAGSVALLPGPDEIDWDSEDGWDDVGLAEPQEVLRGPQSAPEPPETPRRYIAEPPGEPEGASVAPDAPPAHGGKDWRKGQQGAKAAAAPKRTRVTATIRTDIFAKISFALEVPGQIWAVRDPLCGGTFVQQRPDIADALTDIVCDSADLVAFFTGPGGAFMKYMKLAAACWPVVTAVAAHHVYHSVDEAAEDMQQPGYADYAA